MKLKSDELPPKTDVPSVWCMAVASGDVSQKESVALNFLPAKLELE